MWEEQVGVPLPVLQASEIMEATQQLRVKKLLHELVEPAIQVGVRGRPKNKLTRDMAERAKDFLEEQRAAGTSSAHVMDVLEVCEIRRAQPYVIC